VEVISLTLVWIGVALVFAIVEVATVALYAAFVAVGALAAALAAFLGLDLLGQGLGFACVTVLGVVAVRRPLMRYLELRQAPRLLSGAPGMVGQTAVVVDPIGGAHERGHVRILGEDWPALTADGAPVEAGARVEVVDIDKTTLVVHRLDGRPQGNGSR
jgi:membrane protein implicated in regulation of membrane protease activity